MHTPPWVVVAMSLDDPLDFVTCALECESKGINGVPDYLVYGQIIGMILVKMKMDGVDFHQALAENNAALEDMTKLPDTFTKIRNLARETGKFIISGLRLATVEDVQRRLSICKRNECGRMVLTGESIRCSHPSCGCYMSVKAEMQSAECPDGRW